MPAAFLKEVGIVYPVKILAVALTTVLAARAAVRADPIPSPPLTPIPPGEKADVRLPDDPVWRGRRIVTKYADVEVDVRGPLSDTNKAKARVGDEILRVARSQNEQLLVRVAGREGWIKKSDVVRLEEAVAYFSGRIKSEPDSSYFHNKRGTVYSHQGEYDKALSDFTTALKLDPYNVAAHTNQGMIWFLKGNYDKALEAQTEALRLNSKYVAAYNNRGVIWFIKKEYQKALADFDAALRLEPDHINAHNNRAWLWAACPDAHFQDQARAVEEAKRACELSFWENPECLDTLAAAHAGAGNFDEAVKSLKKVLDFPAEELSQAQKDRIRQRLKRYEARQR
jgi:tetratricopeptide (TPR) repeat protein